MHKLDFFLLPRSNININDVLGDYSLGLLESLGTLAVSTMILSHPPPPPPSLSTLFNPGSYSLSYTLHPPSPHLQTHDIPSKTSLNFKMKQLKFVTLQDDET